MAAIDLTRTPDALGTRLYDVVVVGAGAAGLFLASRLSRSCRVLVLESGHFSEDEDRQRLNTVVQRGKPMQAAVWGRKRAVGGSTIAWGGQSLPFSPMDFAARPWVEHSGWPISLSDLEPHYASANRAMGIDDGNYRSEAFELLAYTPPPFDSAIVDMHASKWAPEPNFRRVFARDVEHAFDVAYNAQVTRLRFGDVGVDAVEVTTFEGAKVTVRTPTLVLACGGLETIRTLLVAAEHERLFTPAQRVRLGRGFMDHPCVTVGTVETENGYALQKQFATQFYGKRKASIRLSAAEPFARVRKLLNVSASLMFFPRENAFDPYAEFRDIRGLVAEPKRVLRTTSAFVRTASALIRDRFSYKHGAMAHLSLMCEQEPSDKSRLSLDLRETDRFGIPRLAVNWHVSPKTWESAVGFSRAIRDEFARLRLGVVRLRPEVDGTEDRTDLLSDVNHHMGGAAMGSDPASSVVSPNLSVWGVPNLYACSAAVYPTSSHSNPTLTLLALTDRLADRLLHIR